MIRPIYSLAVLCTVLASVLGGPAAAEPKTRVVVELFTSHGCPACPPAEAFMRDLAARDDVIALEFHIDYYDYAGWTDPFGRPEFTRRWREYARTMEARYEYTPFMVIGGRAHQIGSRRDVAEANIRRMVAETADGPRLVLDMAGAKLSIAVEGGTADGPYDILVATYDRRQETLITGGENRGRKAVNENVVRGFERVGRWTGEPIGLTVRLDSMPGDAGCAVLLQRAGGGPIVAAAEMEFER